MQFVVSTGGLPEGVYSAEFIGIEEWNERAEYGPAVSLKFRVLAGDLEGREGSRICSARLSAKSVLGKFATALKGAAIQAGEAIDFAAFVGTKGSVVVATTDSGSTRIESFIKNQGA